MASPTSTKYLSKLSGKNVLIFGGTSGIGFCVAEACIEHGARVIISGSRASKLSKALERLRNSYPTVSPDQINGYTCDLSKLDLLEESLEALLDSASTAVGGKFNHIVFTAGDSVHLTTLDLMTPKFIQEAGNIRFIAPVILAKLSPKYMVRGPESSITLTGGSITQRPPSNWVVPTAYCAALQGVVRSLAVDLKPVRVNLVEVGAVLTEMWDGLPGEKDDWESKFVELTTVGRVGRPEDTAEAYLYLMKDYFAVGNIVGSDGGRQLV